MGKISEDVRLTVPKNDMRLSGRSKIKNKIII
jgi:hypothetical protein